MMHNKKESLDVAVLREKIRIKKIDRKVYMDEMERVLNGNREKRNALRIGNDCLRFMTRRQNNMTRAINTKIFESRPNSEKLPMMKCDLTTSIVKNDNKLFKYGKRLMKQDYKREQKEYVKKFQEEELARALEEKVRSEEEFHRECESFLSRQVRVEESKNRLVSAKLVYKNLQKVLAELDKNLMEYPFKIKEIEDKIIDRKKEVSDFLELKAGALRFLDIEETQLGPLNEELKIVNAHFEKIISVKKQELDDRRKNNSLGKFLAERETHGFNFTGSSNIQEMKIKARNKALINAQDMILDLMDAMLVSDIKFVVDCIVDQDDVTRLLRNEKEDKMKDNEFLRADLARLTRNHSVLMYNDVKQAKVREQLGDSLKIEKAERERFEALELCLRNQDRLMSEIAVSLQAMFEKMRPIKVADENNIYKGDLIEDIHNFIVKLQKTKSLIEKRTVPVGRVKPLMLRLFKEKRIPQDSIRVEVQHSLIAGQMTAFEAFESDQPGYISREMLKARAEELSAKNKKIKAP
ncbi:coiled-coil domain-containing protein 151 [Biomphalaria pfeifferi]|uniref:Coiled-coil domain-containing protein 151 n=1 Tax=Biomphalaria pfeifferi TaxID=112525 RepID=A0AAD8BAY3_BIOPF|nr:coiled-coil domain-containing protein 151 [Biomphalaria pfeifferi]